MSKFLKIGILIAVPMGLLFWLSLIVDKGLRKAKLEYATVNEVFNGTVNADLVITGSSRAAVQISPKILDSILHINTHNTGMSGWGFHMQYAMFKVYLKYNKKPKYVIQIVDELLLKDREDFYNYVLFLPHTSSDIIIDATQHYKGSFTIPELYFPLFKYNNKLEYIKKGLKYYFTNNIENPSKTHKGFWTNDIPWSNTFDEYKKKNPLKYESKIDTPLLNEFSEFLGLCSKNNIKVILVWAPVYRERYQLVKNIPEFKQIFRENSLKYNFPFLDYSEDSIGLSTKYFYDSYHMNTTGVKVFNPILAHDISTYIQQ
jgi:hypothetical protein